MPHFYSITTISFPRVHTMYAQIRKNVEFGSFPVERAVCYSCMRKAEGESYLDRLEVVIRERRPRRRSAAPCRHLTFAKNGRRPGE